MATDAQGRVLRRPHFLTKTEHDTLVAGVVYGWKQMLKMKEDEVKAEKAKLQSFMTGLAVESTVVVYPKILVRKRLHGVLRWLIRVV